MNGNWKSEYEFTQPRLARIRLVGKVEHDELGALFDRLEVDVEDQPYFLLEVNMSDIDATTPEARRLAAQRLGSWKTHALAVVSTSFAGRMIAKLVLTANDLINRSHSKTAFFKTSDDARDWLLDQGKDIEASAD